MIQRASALYLFALTAMCVAEASRAGVWYSEPVVGLQADYSTDPTLLVGRHTSTADAALLLDVPTSYAANGWSVLLDPTFRFSDTTGYTSLASNYEHFTAASELDTEVTTLKATAVVERDSSLYEDYSFNGSVGVRQDTTVADVTWIRAITEKLSFNFDVNYSRVQYGLTRGFQTLTDYAYSSASPSLAWKTDERTTLTLLGAFSLYNSQDGTTRSTDGNIELGYARQLTELWTFTAKAGISRQSDQISEYFGPFLLGTFKSGQDGTVFSANLTRQGTLATTTLTASRTLVPSGFAFLSRRDLYELQATYPTSERWTLSGYLRYRDEQDPQFFVPTVELKYADVGATAAWLVTTQWTLSLSASHVQVNYGSPAVKVGESAVNLQLSRKFNRIDWH